MTILSILAYAALCGVAGALIAEHRGQHSSVGYVLGFLLGVIGLSILVLIPREGADPNPNARLKNRRPVR